MKVIGASEKIKDINEKVLSGEISELLFTLLNNAALTMKQELYEHTYEYLSHLLKLRHKNLSWWEIEKVFTDISCGVYSIRKISVKSLMEAFNEYQAKRIEKNRNEYEHREHDISSGWADLNKLPFGTAINFRNDMRGKGITKWDDIPLKEIAEKIASGEINYQFAGPRTRKYFLHERINKILEGAIS
ncbi:MAG: hypothetical protein JW723_12295 [Bacteroidales bacterium]|nr:hypothetical protein [Bacteroidales bacterium]